MKIFNLLFLLGFLLCFSACETDDEGHNDGDGHGHFEGDEDLVGEWDLLTFDIIGDHSFTDTTGTTISSLMGENNSATYSLTLAETNVFESATAFDVIISSEDSLYTGVSSVSLTDFGSGTWGSDDNNLTLTTISGLEATNNSFSIEILTDDLMQLNHNFTIENEIDSLTSEIYDLTSKYLFQR